MGDAVRSVPALCGRRLRLRQPSPGWFAGLDGEESRSPPPGSRSVGKPRYAPPDAGRGSAGDADGLAFLQTTPAELFQPESSVGSEGAVEGETIMTPRRIL